MEVEEHRHEDQDQAIQKQRFKHPFARSKILEGDQDHQLQTRSFPKQTPSQPLLAQHYLKHRAAQEDRH